MKVSILSLFIISLLFTQGIQAQNIDSLKTVLAGKEKELESLTADQGKLTAKIAPLNTEIKAIKQLIKPWQYGGFAAVNINQAAFVNWAAGGENSISASLSGNAFAHYEKKRHKWETALDVQWGLLRSKKQTRKNMDVLKLGSNYGYRLNEKGFFAAANFDALSQLTNTRDYNDTANNRPIVSAIGAPLYVKLAVGIDYKPKAWFSLFLSPATGKFTIVRKVPSVDPTTYGVAAGKQVRAEFGASLKLVIEKELVKNVKLKTNLDLFNNYSDPVKEQRANIDVNWQTVINMKINKFISASLSTQLIYDHDTKINIDDNEDGTTDRTAQRTQFAESFGLGFSYKF